MLDFFTLIATSKVAEEVEAVRKNERSNIAASEDEAAPELLEDVADFISPAMDAIDGLVGATMSGAGELMSQWELPSLDLSLPEAPLTVGEK